jgi:hypothetical protein
MPPEVRGIALEPVERFSIAGSFEEHPDDAACQTIIFASGAGRIEGILPKGFCFSHCMAAGNAQTLDGRRVA